MENNNSKKEMNINDLAKLMQAGFEQSDKKFADLDKRMQDGFEQSDKKFTDLDKRMQAGFERSERMMDENIEGLAKIISKSFDGVESDLSELKSDVSELKTDVSGMKDSMTNIEAEVMKKIDHFTHKDLEFRVEKLEKLSKKYA